MMSRRLKRSGRTTSTRKWGNSGMIQETVSADHVLPSPRLQAVMKLTLVSVWFRGRRLSVFVPTKGGRVSKSFMDGLARRLGCPNYGTYTLS